MTFITYQNQSSIAKNGIWAFTAIAILGLFMFGIAKPIGAITLPSGGATPSVSFTTLQQSILKVLDVAIAKLDSAEAKISANTKVSEQTKQDVLASLNKVESGLNNYKTQVAAATTIEELQALNQQIIQYLKDNKDVIKSSAQAVIANIATNGSAKAQQFITQMKQMLKVLEVTCPSQKSAIDALEQQITQMEAYAASFNAAIKAKDSTTIKKVAKDMQVLMVSMINNAKAIQAACLK